MKRELNVEKMKITLEQKNMSLEIIQKLAYVSNIDEYNEYLEELEEANIQPKKLISRQYTNTSWIPGMCSRKNG